jgi:hypothetical protein
LQQLRDVRRGLVHKKIIPAVAVWGPPSRS